MADEVEIVIGSLETITTIVHVDGDDPGVWMPHKGIEYGGGRHVTVADDPSVSTIGWTIQRYPVIESDDETEYSTIVDDQFAAVSAPKLTGLAMAAYAQRRSDYPPGWANKKPKKVPPGLAKD